jgi:tetratricopeptide (TPR) repeat protein
MKRRIALILAVVSLLGVMVLLTGCQKLKARDELNQGVTAYKNQKYADAVEHFKLAVELDPEFPTARLYLAMSYFSQFIPGATSEDNLKMARSAEAEFKNVLKANPNDEIAVESLASLYYNEAQGESSLDAKIEKLNVATEWYDKLIQLNPNKKEAYYTMGVIAWAKTYPRRMTARSDLGMKPDAPGPIKDKKKLEELRSKNLDAVEKGIEYLDKAIQIDNEYDDAMAYINLLYRERADLRETQGEYEKDIEVADNWVEKSLNIKKIKAAREAEKGGGGIVNDTTGQ